MLCGEHAVTGRGLDALLDACCRIELGSSDPAQSARQAMRLAPETSWLVMLTGGQAPRRAGRRAAVDAGPGRAAAAGPGGPVRADDGDAAAPSARLMHLRTLDELPRAILAAAPGC